MSTSPHSTPAPTPHRPPPLHPSHSHSHPSNPLSSFSPTFLPSLSHTSPNTSRPSSPPLEFLVVLPSITRGFRPSVGNINPLKPAVPIAGGATGRVNRANSHQVGSAFGAAGAMSKIKHHRPSVPHTSTAGMGMGFSPLSSPLSETVPDGQGFPGPGMGSHVPSLFPRPGGGSASSQVSPLSQFAPHLQGPGQGQGQGQYRGTHFQQQHPFEMPEEDESPSPATVPQPSGTNPNTDTNAESGGSAKFVSDLRKEMTAHLLDPSRKSMLPSHARRASIGNLAPTGMGRGDWDYDLAGGGSGEGSGAQSPIGGKGGRGGEAVEEDDEERAAGAHMARHGPAGRKLSDNDGAARLGSGMVSPTNRGSLSAKGDVSMQESGIKGEGGGGAGEGHVQGQQRPTESLMAQISTESVESATSASGEPATGPADQRTNLLRVAYRPASPASAEKPPAARRLGSRRPNTSGAALSTFGAKSTKGKESPAAVAEDVERGRESGNEDDGGQTRQGERRPLGRSSASYGSSSLRPGASSGSISSSSRAAERSLSPSKSAALTIPADVPSPYSNAASRKDSVVSLASTADGSSASVISVGWGHVATPASTSGIGGILGKRSRGTGTGRPGWEGEEVVGVLREDGMQVTTFRTTTQMSQHLRNMTAAAGSGASTPNHNRISGLISASSTPNSSIKSQILLVPLSDSPTLPSLSLLLAQGTTPSAICFQQDLLDRARRTESDWLPSALSMISTAVRKGLDEGEVPTELSRKIHVIAYSANPALEPSVVEKCLKAGAIGVIQPPYDNVETLARIRKMVQFAERSQRIRKSFDLQEPRSGVLSADQAEQVDKTLAAEEKLLETASEVPSSGRGSLSKQSDSSQTATPEEAAKVEPKTEAAKTLFSRLTKYDFSSRRRSVDTGGLALALERAKKSSQLRTENSAPQSPGPIDDASHVNGYLSPPLPARQDRSASLAGLEDLAGAKTAQGDVQSADRAAVAELLGEMYRQTRIAIEIHMVDYPEFAAPLSKEHRARLVEALLTWNFQPHALSEADLFRCACLLFEALLRIEGLNELGIEPDQLHRLLFAIRAIYHAPNPYHNYIHAVDVLQASYTFMVAVGVAPPPSILLEDSAEPWQRVALDEAEGGEDQQARMALQSIIRPQDVLAIMIAAMGHDVGHPGLSNMFMKNAKTPLWEIYEDKSVLENMHCMLIVQLLRKHGFSFLLDGKSKSDSPIETGTESLARDGRSEMSPFSAVFSNIPPPTAVGTDFHRDVREGAIGDWTGFKRLVYATVLATDMKIHFDWITRFRQLGKRMRVSDEVWSGEEEADARVLLCQAIIKCADISNPTRPIEVSEHWSSVLLDEWAIQAQLEQELTLPVTVIASADAAIQAKGQIGFIDLFTMPLFDAAADAMPDLRPFAEACSANRALWQSRFDALSALSGSPPPPIKSPMNESPNHPLSLEERYSTLFPMSLPRSLVSSLGAQSSSTEGSRTASSSLTQTPNSVVVDLPGQQQRMGGDHKNTAEVNALRSAYRASISRHGPASPRRERVS